MDNIIKIPKVLSEEKLAQIKAIDAKVKEDIDALPKDNNWMSSMRRITNAAIEAKNIIKAQNS